MAPTGVYERAPRDDDAVFWARVDKDTGPVPDPMIYGDIGRCWIWTGAKRGSGGYGSFTLHGKIRFAHVAAYILTTGQEPPAETPYVTHLCDNGRTYGCVRPSHLKADTHAGNIRGFFERGGKNKIVPAAGPVEIDADGALTVPDVALRLGISVARVRQLIDAGRLPAVKFGRSWLIDERSLRAVAVRKVGRPRKGSKP